MENNRLFTILSQITACQAGTLSLSQFTKVEELLTETLARPAELLFLQLIINYLLSDYPTYTKIPITQDKNVIQEAVHQIQRISFSPITIALIGSISKNGFIQNFTSSAAQLVIKAGSTGEAEVDVLVTGAINLEEQYGSESRDIGLIFYEQRSCCRMISPLAKAPKGRRLMSTLKEFQVDNNVQLSYINKIQCIPNMYHISDWNGWVSDGPGLWTSNIKGITWICEEILIGLDLYYFILRIVLLIKLQ